jgi:hypothetical protein
MSALGCMCWNFVFRYCLCTTLIPPFSPVAFKRGVSRHILGQSRVVNMMRKLQRLGLYHHVVSLLARFTNLCVHICSTYAYVCTNTQVRTHESAEVDGRSQCFSLQVRTNNHEIVMNAKKCNVHNYFLSCSVQYTTRRGLQHLIYKQPLHASIASYYYVCTCRYQVGFS